ncbi:TatD family hydrolase [Thiorhodospira sibirica]|uniref:TatD family hydrolase n=1 Tax=Thiorhodospira sibirica TaxID=154347 RepID=UPI00022C1D54|nr:TatD family hydrolase [Thiorhodospira sibirica]
MLIDSHCHFDHPRFDADRDTCWHAARAAGVCALLVPAIERATWGRLQQLCQSCPGLYPAYGLHPLYLHQHQRADIAALAAWLERYPAVAIGECGLDYADPHLDRAEQQHLLEAQLELAQQYHLPVILHARRAVEAVLLTVRRYPGVRGVVHSFSGSLEQAFQLIEWGFMLGFGGLVSYPQARRVRRVVTAIPLDAMLLESDAPDQPALPQQGMRNEPRWLGTVVESIAALRAVPSAQIAQATAANARQCFALDILPHDPQAD